MNTPFIYNNSEKPDPNCWILLSNEIIQGLSKIEKAIKKKNTDRYEGGFKLLFEKTQVLFDISGMDVNTSPILENLELRTRQRDFIRNILKLVIACRVISTNWESAGIHDSAILVCKEVRDSLRELIRTRKLVERENRVKARETLIRSRKGELAEKESKKLKNPALNLEEAGAESSNSQLDEKYSLPKLGQENDGQDFENDDDSGSIASRTNSERNENQDDKETGSSHSSQPDAGTPPPETSHAVSHPPSDTSGPVIPTSASVKTLVSQEEKKSEVTETDYSGSQYSGSGDYSDESYSSDASTESSTTDSSLSSRARRRYRAKKEKIKAALKEGRNLSDVSSVTVSSSSSQTSLTGDSEYEETTESSSFCGIVQASSEDGSDFYSEFPTPDSPHPSVVHVESGESRHVSRSVDRRSLLPGAIDLLQVPEAGSPATTDANQSSNRMSYQTQVSTLDKFYQANASTNKNRLPLRASNGFTISSLLSEEEPDLSDGYQSWASKKDRTLLRMSLPIWKRKGQTSGESAESEEIESDAVSGGTLFRKPNVSMDVSDDDDDKLIKTQVEEVLAAKRQSAISGQPLVPQPIKLRDGTICRKVLANLIDSFSSQPVDFMEGLFMMALDSTATRGQFVDILEEMIGSLSTLFAILDALGVQDYRAGMSANDAGIRFDLQREFTLRKDTIYSDLDDMIGVAEEFSRQDNPELRQGLTIFLISIIKEYEELLLVSKCIINDPGFITSFSSKVACFDDINNNSKVTSEVHHLQESIRDLLSLNSLRREQEDQQRNPEKAAEALRAYILKLEEPQGSEPIHPNLLPPTLSPSHSLRSLLSDCSAAKYPISVISMERELSLQMSRQSSLSVRSQASTDSLKAPIAARVLMEGMFSGSPVYPMLPKGTTLDAYVICTPTSAPIPSSPSDNSQASEGELLPRQRELPLPGAPWPKESDLVSDQEDTGSENDDSGVDSNGSSDQEESNKLNQQQPETKLDGEPHSEKESLVSETEGPQELLLPTTDYTRLRPANRFTNSTQILSWAISPLGEDMGFIATDVTRADPARSSLSTQHIPTKWEDVMPEHAASDVPEGTPQAHLETSSGSSSAGASVLGGVMVESPTSSATGDARYFTGDHLDESATQTTLDESEMVTRFNALMDHDWPLSRRAVPEDPVIALSPREEGESSSTSNWGGNTSPGPKSFSSPTTDIAEHQQSHDQSDRSKKSKGSKDSGIAVDQEAGVVPDMARESESGEADNTQETETDTGDGPINPKRISVGRLIDHGLMDCDNISEKIESEEAIPDESGGSEAEAIDVIQKIPLEITTPDTGAAEPLNPQNTKALDESVYDTESLPPTPNQPKVSRLAAPEESDIEPSSAAHGALASEEAYPNLPANDTGRKSSDAVVPPEPGLESNGRRPSAATANPTKRESRFKRIMVLAKLSSGGRSSLTYVAPHGAEFFANQPIPPNPYYINRGGAAQPEKQGRRVFRRGSNASSFSNQSASDNGAPRMGSPSASRKNSTVEAVPVPISHKTGPGDASPKAASRKNSAPEAPANSDSRRASVASDDSAAAARKAAKRMSGASSRSDSELRWYLSYNYQENDITMKDGLIITATLDALVERLTLHDEAIDSKFLETFMLTFRSFTKAPEFLDLLIARYEMQPPEGLSPEDLAVWTSHKQTAIRIRVNNILKTWLESYFYESDDGVCLKRLIDFCSTSMMESMPSAAKRILNTAGEIYERLKAESSTSKVTKSKTLDLMVAAAMTKLPNHLPPLPIIPKGIAKSLLSYLPFRIIDLDPVEVARQLTIMDCRAFSQIRPHELIGLEFSKKNSTSVQFVRAMTDATNEITSLICDCILKEPDIKKRCNLVKYFIRMGETLLLLKNFNSLMPIVGALNSSMIARLKKTWALLPPKFTEDFEQLRKATDHSRNYAEYRAVLRTSAPPCLPFLGIYLTDLTFTDEGNSAFTKTETKKYVNFAKYYKTVAIVQEIQKFQVPYNLIEVRELQERLKLWMVTSNSNWDEDAFYQKSLTLEPRANSQPALTSRAKPPSAKARDSSETPIPLTSQAYF